MSFFPKANYTVEEFTKDLTIPWVQLANVVTTSNFTKVELPDDPQTTAEDLFGSSQSVGGNGNDQVLVEAVRP